ncbi:MAG: bifunctional riboflavin kinase/FAD synthetase [Candidatus Goldbacteria bacterium]|nr:bifunctional riboflavin kinase/FAD synthetase [Candidatus Goldiibacteriota bacterium]
MKVLTSITHFKKIKKKVVLTIGVFDGLHIGHQHLIKKTVKLAKAIDGISVVFTFDTHPEKYLNEKNKIKILKDTESKINRLKILGVDIVLIQNFKKIRYLSAKDFISKYIIKNINLYAIVTGKDFLFGKNKTGNISLLRRLSEKYKFKLLVIPDVKIENKKVSSTLIRKYLKAGKIKLVEKMLGGPYSITGTVVHGRHIGFKYPTANIKLKYEDIPATGVWAVRVFYKDKSYLGAANIGTAPTLKNEKKALLEVYIYNFHKMIYGEKLRVVFLEKIRDEKKFKTQEELIKRVDKDIQFIKEKFGKP